MRSTKSSWRGNTTKYRGGRSRHASSGAGNITVPYAGSIRALGRTPVDVQREIEERLKARALEPQAIVTVTERRSNDITVLGEVGTPTRFPAEPAGTKLLSAIARAGGTRTPDIESIITVQRRDEPSRPCLPLWSQILRRTST